MFQEKQLDIPFKISNSRLTVFKRCPIQFYFKYLTNLGDLFPVWPGTLFGKSCHAVLEEIVSGINNGVDSKIILNGTQGLFEKKFFELRNEKPKLWRESRAYKEAEYLASGEKHCRTITKFFLDWLPKDGKIRSEFEISKPVQGIDDVFINGIIDLLVFHPGQCDVRPYSIYDLKVTQYGYTYYFVDWDYELQNVLYEYLSLQELGYAWNGFAFVVVDRTEKTLFVKPYFHNEKNDQRFNEMHVQINRLKRFVFADKKKMNWGAVKKFSYEYEKCKWCPYKKHCQEL